MNFFKPKLVTS